MEAVDSERIMLDAIRLALDGIDNNGGPFGAIITRGSEVIARASNSVTLDNDPTAHAEMNAIRQAAKALNTFNLSGCTLFTSCEPCPMCFSAIYWAHIDEVYYAATREDAHEAGFDDNFIYKQIAIPMNERSIPFVNLDRERAVLVFDKWIDKQDKLLY